MSDNFNKNCPAKMSDGRFLTDYKNSKYSEMYISHINGITSHSEYRNFLTKNAEQIMNKINEYHASTDTCTGSACIHTYPTITNLTQMSAERASYKKGN